MRRRMRAVAAGQIAYRIVHRELELDQISSRFLVFIRGVVVFCGPFAIMVTVRDWG